MSDLKALDSSVLDTVTGGTSGSALANQLSSIADSVKSLTNKTSGFSSSQFLLFAALALQANRPAGGTTVYYSSGRWW
ncbi:MAG: hypothetical protein KF773_11795 [Deltaproteobacteria bacterium]|nr:hypothetical protein [Deltaproteobacteria bacterium]MCW5805070.1 hypothetical protein [Deltaproteobacteria bacterium]